MDTGPGVCGGPALQVQGGGGPRCTAETGSAGGGARFISQPKFRRLPACPPPAGQGPSRRRRVSHCRRLACLLRGCPVCASWPVLPALWPPRAYVPERQGLGQWLRMVAAVWTHTLSGPGRPS
uniref:Uncharacterized protein n=1 Tax=Myotis myotis TaxID=51298 RepID=A0A7J7QWC4_MYOMY|nr:hypothetical protein mMyoMyo1_011292 [Myotis myotis]